MSSRTLTYAALLASLVASACSAKAPAETAPRLVTLATFEGEIDPDAGTFVVRTSSPAGTSTTPSAALVIPTGPGTVTITNTGTIAPNVDGTGGCVGRKVLSAPVRITLDYPSPGFAGGLYAELLTLSGTGAESCDNATPPPGSGLDTSKGLWSYGTVRPGATTSDHTWQFKWTAGQKTAFTGRVVGVSGTTIDVSLATPGCTNFWNYIISYTRAVASGADRIAYGVRGSSGNIAFLDLDGGNQGTVTAPGTVTSLASYSGATAADDILWFTTDSYVGAVHEGVLYPTLAGGTSVMYVTVDPTTPNRAWILSFAGKWFRSVDFNPSTHGLTLGSTIATPNDPVAIAIGPARSPYTGSSIYVASLTANSITAWSLAGVSQGALDWGTSPCDKPNGSISVGSDGKLWYASCSTGTPTCQYCSYDPATNAFARIPVPTTASGSGVTVVGPATTGAGNAVWGIATGVNGVSGANQVLQLAEGATAGATSTTMFGVDLPAGGGWGCGSLQILPSLASSPAVSGHPAYLWSTAYQSIYRMQPQ